MTHAALLNTVLFYFLVFLALLLVVFIGAVIVAPPAAPGSPAPPVLEPPAPPPVQAAAPPQPLPRLLPPATATAGGPPGWPADADEAPGGPVPMPVYSKVLQPKVSGGPPWGPARRPPGPDPWVAENVSPELQRSPEEGSVSPPAGRPASRKPPPGTPAPAGRQGKHPRHGRGADSQRRY